MACTASNQDGCTLTVRHRPGIAFVSVPFETGDVDIQPKPVVATAAPLAAAVLEPMSRSLTAPHRFLRLLCHGPSIAGAGVPAAARKPRDGASATSAGEY